MFSSVVLWESLVYLFHRCHVGFHNNFNENLGLGDLLQSPSLKSNDLGAKKTPST